MNQKIILFASGNGSNAENIFRFFEKKNNVDILTVYTNHSKAGVINRIKPLGVNVEVFNRESFICGSLLRNVINQKPDLIILAGFLWKFGSDWVEAFSNKIVNIHPSLLPKYKGLNTHEKVINNKEKFTGCTVHYVNDKLDSGKIILQKKIKILKKDTPKSIKKRVLNEEHQIYYKAILKIFKVI